MIARLSPAAALLLAAAAAAVAGSPPPRSCGELEARLARLADRPDPAGLTALLDTLRAQGRLPFTHRDTVLFVWRGEARTVAFTGDFDRWQPTPPRARRLGASDVWVQREVFAPDARLDYKIVRDGDVWLLDPANPLRQRGGFGDNSELRMPAYEPSPWVEPRPEVPRGTLAPGRLASAALGHDVDYQVYLPPGHDDLADLPCLYVTDGHEYADPALGALPVVLDNLLAAGRIRPLVAVFIDPRAGGRNLRRAQYVLNPAFARFVARELAPAIDATYRTRPSRTARAILGTSLGGLNAAYLGLEAADTFRLVACQSPAFAAGDGEILRRYRTAERRDLSFFVSWGTYFDGGETTAQMIALLRSRGYPVATATVPEGHSWGSWRAQLDDVLVHFWPAP